MAGAIISSMQMHAKRRPWLASAPGTALCTRPCHGTGLSASAFPPPGLKCSTGLDTGSAGAEGPGRVSLSDGPWPGTEKSQCQGSHGAETSSAHGTEM